jgi:hypothetical protein
VTRAAGRDGDTWTRRCFQGLEPLSALLVSILRLNEGRGPFFIAEATVERCCSERNRVIGGNVSRFYHRDVSAEAQDRSISICFL